MSDWTVGGAEYEHVRQLLLDAPFGRVLIRLKNGRTIEGVIVGQASGTDVGKHLQPGQPPIVTSMWAEFKVQLDDGTIVVISARDVVAIVQMQNP